MTDADWETRVRLPVVASLSLLAGSKDDRLRGLGIVAAEMLMSRGDFRDAAVDPDPARFLARGRGHHDGFPSGIVVREAWELLMSTRRAMDAIQGLARGTFEAYQLLFGYYLGTYEATDLERRLRAPLDR